MYRGAALLQQPGGGGEPVIAPEAEGVPLQEELRDMQLQLPQHHPGRQTEQGGEWSGAGRWRPCVGLLVCG